jgi:uncharacterized protein YjaG (DUF416 family)
MIIFRRCDMSRNYRQDEDPTASTRKLVDAAISQIAEKQESELKSIESQMSIHFEYIRRLNDAESRRINAMISEGQNLRAVDVAAVGVASEKAAAQALVLANQVSASADTLRALVATTASTVAIQLQQVSQQLIDRIALVEKSQYENKGMSSSAAELPERIRMLEESRFEIRGRSGVSDKLTWAIGAAVGGILVFLIEPAMKG